MFPLTLIVFTLVHWFPLFDMSENEPDRVLKAIQTNETLVQQDTNREKLYYQVQFVLAPEVLSCTLSADSTNRIDFVRNSNGKKFFLTIQNP